MRAARLGWLLVLVSILHMASSEADGVGPRGLQAESAGPWPELLGLAGSEAKRIVKEIGGVKIVHVLPENSLVTMDFRVDRVRIFVDAEGRVSRVPSIG